MYTVEFNAKLPWIQDGPEGSGNYSYQGWGEFTLTASCRKYRYDLVLHIAIHSTKPIFFSVKNSIIDNLLHKMFFCELTSTLTYMQANTNRHKTQTPTHTHTNTLFLIWPIKTCEFVNRENVSVVQTHTHTHPAGPVPGKSCDVHKLKQQETCIVSSCQTATVLRGFIVSYFNNATLFHFKLFFL